MTDIRETIASARQGDHRAFDTLFAATLPRLRAFIRLRAGPLVTARESVSDIAQSVCREILEELDDIDVRGEDAFCGLLCFRAAQKILKRRRFHRQARRDLGREQALGGTGADAASLAACYATIASPSRHANAQETLRLIEDAMEQLPEDQRDAVAMSRMLGMSYSEVAAQLGKTESAVRGLVARGLAKVAVRCRAVEP